MNFTSQIEEFFIKVKNKLTQLQWAAFISVLAFGLLAHGYALFNRLSYHDNSASLFSLGGTYESSRWMLGFIYDLQMKTTKLFAAPVFNGVLSLVFIGLAAALIVDTFNISKKISAVFVGAIMAAFPVVTSIFSFMFTAWEYFAALFLAVWTANILIKKISVKTFIAATILLACSLGIYQAFMAVTIAAFLVALTLAVFSGEIDSAGEYVKRGLTYLGNLVAGLVIWFAMAKLTQSIKGIEAVDYKGMSDGYSVSAFPSRLVESIKAFFGFEAAGINSVLYLRLIVAFIVLSTILQLAYLWVAAKNSFGVKLISLIGIALLPIGINVVYLMSTSEDFFVDSLMVFGNIFVFLIPVLLIDRMENEPNLRAGVFSTITIRVTWVQIIALAVVLVGYIYLDNGAYLKAELAEEQATAYYTELVANIKATEGFSDDMEIVFVGWTELEDGTNAKIDTVDQLEAIKLEKFPRFTDIITYGGSRFFMQEHLGFGNDKLIEDNGTYAKKDEVKDMPTYPNSGSIKVIDNKVIVKLGEASPRGEAVTEGD
ncbi:MAG: glucosyltransferase domain-containing protein [Pseudobutyrivibrio sp.]|nr:glucosyltransferase domain-containing protein [Pseudobutyrivibrio sp.]